MQNPGNGVFASNADLEGRAGELLPIEGHIVPSFALHSDLHVSERALDDAVVEFFDIQRRVLLVNDGTHEPEAHIAF